MGAARSHEHVMRMRFELERDDNPPLFDELMKFPKGTKRLNRLRTLAHEGLHTQRGWGVPTPKAEAKLNEEAVARGSQRRRVTQRTDRMVGGSGHRPASRR